MEIIIAFAAVMWVWSFTKFKKRYKLDSEFLDFLSQRFVLEPGPESQVEYASGLMICQKYNQALALFEDLKERGYSRIYTFLDDNIAFCKKPHPWSAEGKDFNGSWRHNFLLVRLGKRRQIYITPGSQLEFNSFKRAINRQRR